MHHLLCKQQLSSLQGFRHLHNMQLHPNSINFSDVHPSLTPDLPAPNTQEDKKGCMKALGGEKQRVKHTSCGTQILDWSCCWIPCLCPPQNKPNESGVHARYNIMILCWLETEISPITAKAHCIRKFEMSTGEERETERKTACKDATPRFFSTASMPVISPPILASGCTNQFQHLHNQWTKIV